MKSKILELSLLLSGFAIIGTLIAFQPAPRKPWNVPAKYESMTNPVKSDPESLKEGKELWSKHCSSCHGKTGLGDGTKAAQLKTEAGDLTTSEFQQQSNGNLFYKISEGRGDMPGFKKKLDGDEDIWNLVNYVRTLKK
jgi:mono/diheme cytochrome c family protein